MAGSNLVATLATARMVHMDNNLQLVDMVETKWDKSKIFVTAEIDRRAQLQARFELGFNCDVHVFLNRAQDIKTAMLAAEGRS